MADRQLDEIILSMLTLSSFSKVKEEIELAPHDSTIDSVTLHSCLLTTEKEDSDD